MCLWPLGWVWGAEVVFNPRIYPSLGMAYSFARPHSLAQWCSYHGCMILWLCLYHLRSLDGLTAWHMQLGANDSFENECAQIRIMIFSCAESVCEPYFQEHAFLNSNITETPNFPLGLVPHKRLPQVPWKFNQPRHSRLANLDFEERCVAPALVLSGAQGLKVSHGRIETTAFGPETDLFLVRFVSRRKRSPYQAPAAMKYSVLAAVILALLSSSLTTV